MLGARTQQEKKNGEEKKMEIKRKEEVKEEEEKEASPARRIDSSLLSKFRYPPRWTRY